MNLANKVLIALGMGLLVGLIINFSGASNLSWVNDYIINGLFKVGGGLFVNALKMLIVPLVLFSLIPGILGIGNISLLGKIGTKSFALYVATTAIAITTAITLAALSGIGTSLDIPLEEAFAGKEAAKSFTEILIGIVPANIISAMANADMLAIIFFSIFFGIALLIDLVGKAVAELGLDIVIQISGYFMVIIFALLFHAFVTQMIILKVFTGLDISLFLKKIRNAQMFAFSTSSSGATIPITLRTVQERLGVDKSVSAFSVPFGATINMDGTAMMQGVATVFIANLYGVDFGITEYVTIVVTAVLASIGTAAVPSVGLVMLTLVFSQVGLPIEAIGYILGIDRIVDMTRTAVNVTGDTVVTTIVAKSEDRIDLDVFNDPNAGNFEEVHVPENHTPEGQA